jgi:hypothetical protein
MPKRVCRAWSSATSNRQDRRGARRAPLHAPDLQEDIRRSKKYHAHDENNQFKPGDMVWIEECADLEAEALGPGRTQARPDYFGWPKTFRAAAKAKEDEVQS